MVQVLENHILTQSLYDMYYNRKSRAPKYWVLGVFCGQGSQVWQDKNSKKVCEGKRVSGVVMIVMVKQGLGLGVEGAGGVQD